MSDGSFGRAAARLSSAASLLLGWRPDEFWNATPTEFAAAMILVGGDGQAPDAGTIAALRQRFPDKEKA
jgi:hypothetical protein